jgi:hypothetical protein
LEEEHGFSFGVTKLQGKPVCAENGLCHFQFFPLVLLYKSYRALYSLFGREYWESERMREGSRRVSTAVNEGSKAHMLFMEMERNVWIC